MRKLVHLMCAIAFLAAPLAMTPGVIATAHAVNKKSPPPKLPPAKNGVCWHWSHGKATAHPC